MCDCMDVMLTGVTDRVTETLPSNADHTTLSVAWENKVFRLDGRQNNVMLGVEIEYRKLKTDGSHHKNMSRDKIRVAMSHCPFCGEQY